jgi:hypothetical protein
MLAMDGWMDGWRGGNRSDNRKAEGRRGMFVFFFSSTTTTLDVPWEKIDGKKPHLFSHQPNQHRCRLASFASKIFLFSPPSIRHSFVDGTFAKKKKKVEKGENKFSDSQHSTTTTSTTRKAMKKATSKRLRDKTDRRTGGNASAEAKGRTKRRKTAPPPPTPDDTAPCNPPSVADEAKEGGEPVDWSSPLDAMPNEILAHILRFLGFRWTLHLAGSSASLRDRVRCLAHWDDLIRFHSSHHQSSVFEDMRRRMSCNAIDHMADLDGMDEALACASMCRPEACVPRSVADIFSMRTDTHRVMVASKRVRISAIRPHEPADATESQGSIRLLDLSCVANGIHVQLMEYNEESRPRVSKSDVLIVGQDLGERNVRWLRCGKSQNDERVVVFRLHAKMTVPACKFLSRNVCFDGIVDKVAKANRVSHILLAFYRAPLTEGGMLTKPPHFVRARWMYNDNPLGKAKWKPGLDLNDVVLAYACRTPDGQGAALECSPVNASHV